MTRSLKKTQKVKANAQGYSHLPTYLMVLIDRSNTNMFKTRQKGLQSNSAPILSLFSLYNAPWAQQSYLVTPRKEEELQCSVVNSGGPL